MTACSVNIGTICNGNVITVKRDSTALEAARLMRKHHVGDVIVTDVIKGKLTPIGIVTDRDIVVELVATGLDCNVMTSGDIMTDELVMINKNTDIFEGIHTMMSKGVRRLPVVNDQGELVGIVTHDDLLLLLSKEIGLLSTLVKREQKNEVAKRR